MLILLVALAAGWIASADAAATQPYPPGGVLCGEAGAAPADVSGLAVQVLLDRRNFSPGVIDGTLGRNASRALAAFQSSQRLEPSGIIDCATWQALGGASEPVTHTYVVTDEDARGPFASRIPDDLLRQAALPALSYQSLEERLAERFHTSAALLARLNRGVRMIAGAALTVPAVVPFDETAKPPAGAPEIDWIVEVSRDESSLRVVGDDGRIALFAPVSSGSEHDPLPLGEWKVNSVHWMPKFHYNPQLFWDADAAHSRATIAPGPNNPVGVVWIDINVEHYGLHGTPEPARVGYGQSHGCVRLTNWDAARLASLVKPGTRVVFR
jgi:lipoprotein-anchoring transpeptidase ErfK/SrfK